VAPGQGKIGNLPDLDLPRSIRGLLEDLLEGGVALAEGEEQGGVELRLVGVQQQAADGGVRQPGLVDQLRARCVLDVG
jgi:hypothetical protein